MSFCDNMLTCGTESLLIGIFSLPNVNVGGSNESTVSFIFSHSPSRMNSLCNVSEM